MTALDDLCCPIFNHSEGAVASLTAPFLRQRDVAVTADQALELLVEVSGAISAALGARPAQSFGFRR